MRDAFFTTELENRCELRYVLTQMTRKRGLPNTFTPGQNPALALVPENQLAGFGFEHTSSILQSTERFAN